MKRGNRLPDGGLIDRERQINFTFNGRSFTGLAGDSVASALLANDRMLIGRSFKYHRPRGIMSAGYEEPGALVEFEAGSASGNEIPALLPLREGMRVKSVNCWPSPEFDLGGVNQLLAPLLPAGFYYKTFMRPDWALFEPWVRRAAGLAAVPRAAPEEGAYETRNLNCDILVVGAGAAGLTAASIGAASGLRIVIADMDRQPGGALLGCEAWIEELPGTDWVRKTAAELKAADNVRLLRNTLVWACREQNLLMARQNPERSGERERNWRLRARQLIIATGAVERMMVFPGNDRPGVMLASSVRNYVHRYAVRPGRRALIFTCNDTANEAVPALTNAGIEIAAIVDTRPEPQSVPTSGIRHIHGAAITRTSGRKRVRGALIRHANGRMEQIECDLVALSGGWNPSLQLWSQARQPITYNHRTSMFVPVAKAAAIRCAGAADGCIGLAAALRSGAMAGAAAIKACGCRASAAIPECSPQTRYNAGPWWHDEAPGRAQNAFVDVMNDVTLADIHLALREGYRSIEHVKRYTTAGMGLDQGRTGNVNIVGAIAEATAADMETIGVTTFRSPVAPVSFGSIQGTREGSVLLPYRHTPLTEWNVSRGAVMYEAGARWRRPGYFPQSGESMHQAVNREAGAVRNSVGVYDGSPLGTFAVKGRDAARLLDMLYTNRFSDLPLHQGRYGIMLTDDGLILDDGVSFRLGECEFLMSTSTANAARVYRHVQKFLHLERPDWQVWMTDLTCQWMNATICGPAAREIVAALGTDIDLGRGKFPFMTIREGMVAGLPARISRVSFTGELSFEINVRARDLCQLWERVIDAGKAYGITPIGSETNHVLRVEKGFLSLGHEVDGTTDPYDLGMGWIMSKKKSDFLGKRSVSLRRRRGVPRRELVGLATADPAQVIPEGAPLTPGGRREKSEGVVTASVWSECCGRSVSLALLQDGRARHGETVHIRTPEEVMEARVTGSCAWDPQGTRMRS
ncbi:MAG: 2Fe-2S iron-sulfur cluster-binding protein [Rhodobacteraceae bacterium]|nr:2Fe-2S iron-sulfur cluster-binding protein [Paracoccaceae bacterium]